MIDYGNVDQPKSKLIKINKPINQLFAEVCKFHEKYYIAGGYSRRIRNIYTKQDCAIDVHKIYPDATGAQWNGYNYCFARFGGKFSLRDDRYHSWACIFQPLYQGNP